MSEISNAIKHICDEKGLDADAVVATIEFALAAAYRKDFGQKNQNIVVEFDVENATSKVYDVKTVVEDMPEELKSAIENEEGDDEKHAASQIPQAVKPEGAAVEADHGDAPIEALAGEEERKFNPKVELQISDAKLIKKTAKVGDVIKTKLEVPDEYGRMAAQTAKQVIIQRLREAEREMVFNDFKDKQGEVVGGIVQRREGRIVLIDLGKSAGVIPPDEQIPGEKYLTGARIKVYVKEVSLKSKGAEIILSRTSDEILRKIFYLEIPEVSNGLIEIKGIAREAGSRSKVAVWTDSDNIDPIGSCVGQRGSRIQTIISELGGEKVDIIEYDENVNQFISNALSPAKIIRIRTNEDNRKATVVVASDQLSLAIGKSGQNARLAAKLTGWKIDIVEESKDVNAESIAETVPESQEKPKAKKEKKAKKQAKEEEADEEVKTNS